jgi:hypothetical protein
MYQLLAILVGLISGITWEKLGLTPYKNIPTITPSLIVNVAGKNLHLHHWLLYLGLLIILLIITYKTNRLTHPSALMIFSFLLGAMVYNLIKFPDWHIFLK